MALPGYDKSKRRRSTGFEKLPKDAYVLKILNVKEEANKSGNGTHLTISFDIAEGDYKDFYLEQYNNDDREDKVWPYDARYYLTVPADNSAQYVHDNWNTFFADLEDSNEGFVFKGSLDTLKGKIIGGKFNIEQTEYNGNVYDHTRLKWTCLADDVRNDKAGKLPNDKMIAARPTAPDDFINIPDSIEEEAPFI